MKNREFEAKILFAIYFVLQFLFPSFALSGEISERLKNPFLLPQTGFLLGNSSYTVQASDSSGSSSTLLNSSGINTYGLDIELNYSNFVNVGAYLRVESLETVYPNRKSQFTGLLGGFARLFYSPSFLTGKTVTTSFFSRVELGAGPGFFSASSSTNSYVYTGIMGQTGIYIGIETYFSKWLGLGLSYGQLFELGRSSIAYPNPATLWSQGNVVFLSLKTTLF